MPTSQGWSRVRVRQVVCGCVLEGDANAAARGVFDGLFGLVTEAVALQAATGRSHGGEVGTGARVIRPPGRRTRRTIEGSIAGMTIRKACRAEGEGTKERDVLAY